MKRSAEFSSDPMFDPAELFEVIENDESRGRVRAAMMRFVTHNDPQLLSQAIAIFVRSARARGDSIERVLASLESLANASEGTAREGYEERDTPLRQLALRGVLLAFYGAEAVDREKKARERRAAARRRTNSG